MAKVKIPDGPIDYKIPRPGTIINPDNFVMHVICRIWREDHLSQIKFECTRILVNCLVEIELDKLKEPKSDNINHEV